MEDFNNPLARKRVGNARYSVGIGYIVLPVDIERLNYIQNCFNTGKVCILTEDGEFIVDVHITIEALNNIKFPLENDENSLVLGSAVTFINEPINNRPIIIGCLQKTDEIFSKSENEFNFFKKGNNGGSIMVSGQAEKGIFLININANDIGKAIITVNGKNGSEFDLNVNGKANINCTESLNIKAGSKLNFSIHKPEQEAKETLIAYQEGVGLNYKDEFDNEIIAINDEIQIKARKLRFNEGGEPILLGNKTISFLKSLIDEISKITTITAIGTQPIVNIAQIIALKETLDPIKSQINFTD